MGSRQSRSHNTREGTQAEGLQVSEGQLSGPSFIASPPPPRHVGPSGLDPTDQVVSREHSRVSQIQRSGMRERRA
jgi:hypothetical protein